MSTTIPDDVLFRAGFVLAHAIWSVSDLEDGETLVPLGLAVTAGEQELIRFVAKSKRNEDAVAQAYEFFNEHGSEYDAWALACDVYIRDQDTDFNRTDAIKLEVWARDCHEAVAFIQRFLPFKSGRFKLLGEPSFIVDDVFQCGPTARKALEKLHEGVLSHPAVADLWESWQ